MTAPRPSRGTVLTADDEPSLRRLMEIVLLEAGFTVLQAEDGEQACDLVQQHRPNLALLDIAMPRLDGLNAARWIRRHYPNIKIVFVAAGHGQPQWDAAEEIGVEGFLIKPFSPATLMKLVDELLPLQPEAGR